MALASNGIQGGSRGEGIGSHGLGREASVGRARSLLVASHDLRLRGQRGRRGGGGTRLQECDGGSLLGNGLDQGGHDDNRNRVGVLRWSDAAI
jgi:hypothetical protein